MDDVARSLRYLAIVATLLLVLFGGAFVLAAAWVLRHP